MLWSGRIPGMCKDDVVARMVLAAAAGRSGAGETEFKDHVGGYVGSVEVRCANVMQWLRLSPSRWPTPTICGAEVCRL
jgi:hypothetical protein